MDTSLLLNRRVMAILLLFSSFIILICFGLYSFGQPKFDAAITASKEKEFEVASTATGEVLNITQLAENTLISQFQTETAFPTSTEIPTATITATSTPELRGCSVELKAGTFLYGGPSLGLATSAPQEMQVVALAKAQNLGWIKIENDQNAFVWVREKDLKANNCNLQSLPLSFLMGGDVGQQIILEESFLIINDWVYKPSNETISPVKRSGRDFQVLPLGKERQNTESSLRKPFGYLKDFLIITSFNWFRSGDFGVRFWNDGTNYYDVLITPECYIEIYDSDELLINRQIVTDKTCYNQGDGETTNYLEVKINDNNLSVKLNEAESISYPLQNLYTGENIGLITKGSIVDLEYFILAAKR